MDDSARGDLEPAGDKAASDNADVAPPRKTAADAIPTVVPYGAAVRPAAVPVEPTPAAPEEAHPGEAPEASLPAIMQELPAEAGLYTAETVAIPVPEDADEQTLPVDAGIADPYEPEPAGSALPAFEAEPAARLPTYDALAKAEPSEDEALLGDDEPLGSVPAPIAEPEPDQDASALEMAASADASEEPDTLESQAALPSEHVADDQAEGEQSLPFAHEPTDAPVPPLEQMADTAAGKREIEAVAEEQALAPDHGDDEPQQAEVLSAEPESEPQLAPPSALPTPEDVQIDSSPQTAARPEPEPQLVPEALGAELPLEAGGLEAFPSEEPHHGTSPGTAPPDEPSAAPAEYVPPAADEPAISLPEEEIWSGPDQFERLRPPEPQLPEPADHAQLPADVHPQARTHGLADLPSMSAAPPVAALAAIPSVSLPSREAVRDGPSFARQAARIAGAVATVLATTVLLLILVYRWIDPPASTLMLGQRLVGTEIDQRWVPIQRMSPHLIQAVILSEDGAFCRHSGVDWGAMGEAIESARGGSTITMQVVKNLFLWPARSYVRKALEIVLAYVVETVWTKQRILEIYLNIAEWGPGVFGAEAAARNHFGKRASQLSAQEAALLAVSLPNPIERQAGHPGWQTRRLGNSLLIRMRAARGPIRCVRAG